MHTGEHVCFSHSIVYAPGFGVGRFGGLPVCAAMQASANFPGAFPLRLMRSEPFNFRFPERLTGLPVMERRRKGTPPELIGVLPKALVLSDGGVFDNLADAWHTDAVKRRKALEGAIEDRQRELETNWLQERPDERQDQYNHMNVSPGFAALLAQHAADRQRWLDALGERPRFLIAINAGSERPWREIRKATIPFVGELYGVSAALLIMYNTLTTRRATDLSWSFVGNRRKGVGSQNDGIHSSEEQPKGTVVDMKESIIGHAPSTEGGYKRAEYLFKAVGKKAPFDNVEEITSQVPTTFRPLGIKATAALLYHGYFRMMFELVLEHDMPIPNQIPTLDDFMQLAKGYARPNIDL
jgi:hypothetical protein